MCPSFNFEGNYAKCREHHSLFFTQFPHRLPMPSTEGHPPTRAAVVQLHAPIGSTLTISCHGQSLNDTRAPAIVKNGRYPPHQLIRSTCARID